MTEVFRFTHPVCQFTGTVQQLVTGMHPQIDIRYVQPGRLTFACIFQQLETKLLPQIEIVPVLAKSKGRIKNIFFHQYGRVLH